MNNCIKTHIYIIKTSLDSYMKEGTTGIIAQYKTSTTISKQAYMKNITGKNNLVESIYNCFRAHMYKGYNRKK